MFSGYTAAARQAFFEDLFAGGEHAFNLIGITLVKQQDRMDVSVAGMKYVHRADPVLRANVIDSPQNMRQFGAGHDAVLRAVTGAQSPHGAERLLPRLPK